MGFSKSHAVTGAVSTVHLSLCTVLTDTEGFFMAKNHRKKREQNREQNLTSTPSRMRDREVTRAYKALRSAELTKARQLVTNQFNQEVIHAYENRKLRPSQGQSVPPQVPGRRLPNQSELRRSGLPSQVRHELQDYIRAVVCQSRRTRRETLFALRRSGKIGRVRKKARWTEQSHIRCK